MGASRYKEYLLPHQFGEGLGHSNDADPWSARFSGLRSDEVAELLREDWAKIQAPAVVMFRDSLRPFQPSTLIHCADERDFRSDSGWWLCMNGPPTHNEWDTQVFLTAPPDRGGLQESIAQYGFPEREVIAEFCWFFYQMQNDIGGSASGFIPPP